MFSILLGFCGQVWSATKGNEVAAWLSPGPLNCVSFHPEEHLLAAGCWNGNVIMWNWLQNKSDRVSSHWQTLNNWFTEQHDTCETANIKLLEFILHSEKYWHFNSFTTLFSQLRLNLSHLNTDYDNIHITPTFFLIIQDTFLNTLSVA